MRRVPSFSVILFLALVVSVGAQEKAAQPDEVQPAPKTDKEYFSEGRSLERKGKYEAAAKDFQRAIALNPKSKASYDNLGFCLAETYKYDDAIAAFNQAIALDPKDSYAFREIGICYYHKKDFENATDFVQAAIKLNPSDPKSHFWLGYIYYQSKNNAAAINALDEALKLEPKDFDSNYWRGMVALRMNAFGNAETFLKKSANLRPKDFNANLWLGTSFVRDRKFKEAIPAFEKAHEIKPNDTGVKFELFSCYLATNQPENAARIYPRVIGGIAGVLVIVYCLWFAVLLPFSLPVRDRMFPGFWFSLGWLGLFFEGQIAFLLLLSSLPWLGLHEVILNGTMLAGLPIVVTALIGFARQPWGQPFQWPPRFGGAKTILISLMLILGMLLVSGFFAQLYTFVTHKPFPLQRTIPMIRAAIQANPVAAWLGIALVIPCIEEILFRGLLFGALSKSLGVVGAVLVSSFVFVCVHLQFFGFLALFMLGVILAWARFKTGSLGLPIALHGLNNAIAMAVLTFGPQPPSP